MLGIVDMAGRSRDVCHSQYGCRVQLLTGLLLARLLRDRAAVVIRCVSRPCMQPRSRSIELV